MQVSPASGSKDRVARCLLECPEKFKTSKPSTFPPLLLDAPTLPSFARLLLLDFRLLSARPPSSLFFSFFFFYVCRRRIERRPCFRANHPMENRALRQIDLEIINFTTIGFVRLGDILDDNAVSQKADSIGSFDKFMPFGEFILLMTCFMNRAIKTINLARSSAV